LGKKKTDSFSGEKMKRMDIVPPHGILGMLFGELEKKGTWAGSQRRGRVGGALGKEEDAIVGEGQSRKRESQHIPHIGKKVVAHGGKEGGTDLFADEF